MDELKTNSTHNFNRSTSISMLRAAAAYMALSGGMGFSIESSRGEPEISERPCLHCKKPKRHNNAFCSAECCKNYTLKQKSYDAGDT